MFVATVLTVYGIETKIPFLLEKINSCSVATVLTVYGIETYLIHYYRGGNYYGCNSTYRLRY